MKNIITTVGTSLFSNYMKPDVADVLEIGNKHSENDFVKKTYEQLMFKPASKFDENERAIKYIKKILEENWFKGIIRDESNNWILGEDTDFNTYASAEIKSLLSIQKKINDKSLEVHLIATDTVLSRLAAELIVKWFEEYNKETEAKISVYFNPQTEICRSLQVTDGEVFEREGIPNLINLCDKVVAGNYENTVINITGGYKTILPYMTIYAQVNSIPLYYIFEDTDSLIHIPQAPIDINWNLFEKHWERFASLENGEIVNTNVFPYEFLQEAAGSLEISDQVVVLNPLGVILWKKYKSRYFLFMAPDDIWSEIQTQKDIGRIIRDKFTSEKQRTSKTEKKQDHYVFDDGNNNNRIYYIEEGGIIYVYKTFENEEKAKAYINEKINKKEIMKASKIRKVEVHNV